MSSEPRGLPILAKWLRRLGNTSTAGAPNGLPRPGGVLQLPKPALRWIGTAGRVAVRSFDWDADSTVVCQWQEETYALNFEGFKFSDAFANAFRTDLRRATMDGDHGLFMLDDGHPCGFMWLVICRNTWTGERYGYINNLYIVPERRGEGFGEDLLHYSEDWFKKRKVSRLRLTVTVSNAAACHLYEKAGYRVTRWEMEKDV